MTDVWLEAYLRMKADRDYERSCVIDAKVSAYIEVKEKFKDIHAYLTQLAESYGSDSQMGAMVGFTMGFMEGNIQMMDDWIENGKAD